MTSVWESGHYADPQDPLKLDAWDKNRDGTIKVNPSERHQRFYFPPPTATDQNNYVETAEQVAGAIATDADMTQVKSDVANQGSAITNLQSVQAASRSTQAWVSPDIQDMASFPYYLMQPIPKVTQPSGLFGWGSATSNTESTTVSGGSPFTSTSSVDGSTGKHSHNVNTSFSVAHSHEIKMVNPTFAPTSKTIDFSVIVVDRFAYLDQFKFCSGRDGSIFGINSMLASLYVLNPLNGNLEKIYASPELKGSYNQAQKMYALDLTGGGSAYQQCTPGQILFAALWQDTSGFLQGARGVGCTYTPNYEVNTKSWLKTGAFTLASQNTMPSSISYTDLVPNYNRQFWAGITTG